MSSLNYTTLTTNSVVQWRSWCQNLEKQSDIVPGATGDLVFIPMVAPQQRHLDYKHLKEEAEAVSSYWPPVKNSVIFLVELFMIL